MVEKLLKIKTSIPPPASRTVLRESFEQKMDTILQHGDSFSCFLTLVSAPAGFGKTTAVRNWLRGKEGQTAWLSLNEEESEPGRFWFYLVSALQNIQNNIGAGLLASLKAGETSPSSRDGSSSPFLITLLNELFDLENPLLLILDDYHRVDNPQVHEEMAFFLENLPPTVHMVVITRSDPPWPLSRWRAGGKIIDIRLSDLRFSAKETSQFLSQNTSSDLKDPHLKALHKKTEGWAAGLQLVAFSLSSCSNIDEFVSTFTGSQRHIFHFLSEEVFQKQPPSIQNFLLETSILTHFNASLCNAVTGRKDGQELLSRLEKNNLFVIPLDQEGNWYRYHQLFADLLSSQLKVKSPEKISELHARAGKWLLEAGEPGQAIRHARAENNLEKVALILDSFYDEILQAEEPSLRSLCLEILPAEIIINYPRLIAYRSLFHLVQKGKEGVEEDLLLAEKSGKNKPEFLGLVKTVQTYSFIYSNQLPQAMASAQEALKLLPSDDYYWRMSLNVFMGDVHLISGNPRRGYKYYLEAHHSNQHMDNFFLSLSTGIKLATCLLSSGELQQAANQAAQLLKKAREKGASRLPRAGSLWVLLGEIHREKGKFDEAERCLERGLHISRAEKPSYAWNLQFKIGLAYSRRKFPEALATINLIRKTHKENSLPYFILKSARDWEARIKLQQNQEQETKGLLAGEKVSFQNEVLPGRERAWLNLCRLVLNEKEKSPGFSRAMDIIELVEKRALSGENKSLYLETQLVKAQLENKIGNTSSAVKTLALALKEGEKSGFFQLFIDEGIALKPVFSQVLKEFPEKKICFQDSGLKNYIQDIHRKLQSERTGSGSPQASTPSELTEEKLIEELTSREIEILKLISRGLSNQEIARELFLSLNTVKWYNGNIFGKLGVKRRTHAVAEARRLNLIP